MIEYAARKAFERAGDTGNLKWDDQSEIVKNVWRTYVKEVAHDLAEKMSHDKQRGLYEKFRVLRVDGRSAIGERHENCEYFVLDLTHDSHALPAIRAYARSCAAEYPLLAEDLLSVIKQRETDG